MSLAALASVAGSSPPVFDAHNHIHMSMPGRVPPFDARLLHNWEAENSAPALNESISKHARNVASFFSPTAESSSGAAEFDSNIVKGMALMSTQPRDFVAVDTVCNEFEHRRNGLLCGSIRGVRCYGVHPWFLHEAEADGAACVRNSDTNSFWWEQYLRQSLMNCPSACVGEIGLDSARYDPKTQKPHTPIERQIEAFELQMWIATELQRPVSIHAVQAWGPLLDTLNKKFGKKKGDKPSRLYFHAFGGEPAVVDQIDAAAGKRMKLLGFAPIINFRSPKTADVIRKVGIDRLVLESDRENYILVKNDLAANANYIAEALEMDPSKIEKTSENAFRFYGIHD
eukprot:CAMPEP_0113570970 /NCGR_PEP_ID=MMETSP0015_2-20120614/25290_1 /TAXON_ID=2838 /ORGANISM="Odontella" /LENGTH=341 /DNA_ID=CAMNT_0000473861 /DNA_START=271 /DNA_END=1297 /DNA_ORIENTATION=- /assembly_acc=CAM_ASM_000160